MVTPAVPVHMAGSSTCAHAGLAQHADLRAVSMSVNVLASTGSSRTTSAKGEWACWPMTDDQGDHPSRTCHHQQCDQKIANGNVPSPELGKFGGTALAFEKPNSTCDALVECMHSIPGPQHFRHLMPTTRISLIPAEPNTQLQDIMLLTRKGHRVSKLGSGTRGSSSPIALQYVVCRVPLQRYCSTCNGTCD